MVKRYTRENYTQEQYEKDAELVEAVEGPPMINFSDSSRHLQDKEKILIDILGYNGLRVGSNRSETRFIPISECNPARVTQVIKERYYAALSRIRRFGDPSKRQETGPRGLEPMLERTGQYRIF